MKFVDELLTGDEMLTFNGTELANPYAGDGLTNPYSVKQYWRINLSTLLLNMTRGGFAEFLVLCALNQKEPDKKYVDQLKNGVEAWDIDGPDITIPRNSTRKSRIEVKSAAAVQIYTPEEKVLDDFPLSQLKFSIRKARDWSVNDDTQRRNNDLYVFCHYKATKTSDNMLELSLWDFYVYPTYLIENNKSLSNQKTISVRRLQMLGVEPCGFDSLAEKIHQTIKQIENKDELM